ncbi:MAG TPA: cyclase family protein [Desulfotomaculum sp.]|nr:cyclase family protein [Desulfotomaculum sp.]
MRIVDLTVELADGTQSFPTHPKVTVIDFVTHSFSAPRYKLPCRGYASKLVMLSDHAGTHLDAPFHFYEDGPTINQVDLSTTFGEAVLLDVSSKQADMPVSADMLEKAAAGSDVKIKPGDIVLLHIWPGEWNGPGFHHCKALDESAANWLAGKKIKALGLDLANADVNENMQRPVHLKLLGQGIGIIENLTNLWEIRAKRFHFFAVPLKIAGLSGSPVRAFAIEGMFQTSE